MHQIAQRAQLMETLVRLVHQISDLLTILAASCVLQVNFHLEETTHALTVQLLTVLPAILTELCVLHALSISALITEFVVCVCQTNTPQEANKLA